MHFLKDHVPTQVTSYVIETILNRRFDHELFGLRPAHPLFYEHPTVNDEIAGKILCGRVVVKGDVERMTQNGVIFKEEILESDNNFKGKTIIAQSDEASQEIAIDSLILATGFHVDYPFLSKSLRQNILKSESNSVNLYKYVFPIDPNDESFMGLGFIGVPNALGPLFPIAEVQSRWMVQVMTGQCQLPPTSAMKRELAIQEWKRKE